MDQYCELLHNVTACNASDIAMCELTCSGFLVRTRSSVTLKLLLLIMMVTTVVLLMMIVVLLMLFMLFFLMAVMVKTTAESSSGFDPDHDRSDCFRMRLP